MTDRYTDLRAAVDIPQRWPAGLVTVDLKDLQVLLADYDRMREALEKVRPVIAADRQALLDSHGNGTEIPATDELGTLGLYEYDGAIAIVDAALAQEGS